MAYWEGTAKFRMHTDSSLKELQLITTAMGNCLRHFADVVCSHYKTVETDSEVASRKRAEARAAKKTGMSQNTGSARKQRTFNLATFKLHNLGYYPAHIKYFGTTDSYDTRIVGFFFFLDCIMLKNDAD